MNHGTEIARKNWLRASKDLGFAIETPYSISAGGEKKEVFAFLPSFGSPKGMLLGITNPPEFKTDAELICIAKEQGLYYSFINIESVLNYDRKVFEDAIQDWSLEGVKRSEKKHTDNYIGDLQQLKADIVQFFTNFTAFIKERVGHKKAKELIILIFIAGAGSTILPEFTGWGALASTLTLAGIFGGFASYYVQGFFYRLGITLSGGKMEWGMARNVTLFSGLPMEVAALATYFLNVLVFGGPSTGLDAALTPFDYIGLLLYAVFFCMSLMFCYKAARNIAGTAKIRSILFLVIIPAICTVLLLALGTSLQAQ